MKAEETWEEQQERFTLIRRSPSFHHVQLLIAQRDYAGAISVINTNKELYAYAEEYAERGGYRKMTVYEPDSEFTLSLISGDRYDLTPMRNRV